MCLISCPVYQHYILTPATHAWARRSVHDSLLHRSESRSNTVNKSHPSYSHEITVIHQLRHVSGVVETWPRGASRPSRESDNDGHGHTPQVLHSQSPILDKPRSCYNYNEPPRFVGYRGTVSRRKRVISMCKLSMKHADCGCAGRSENCLHE